MSKKGMWKKECRARGPELTAGPITHEQKTTSPNVRSEIAVEEGVAPPSMTIAEKLPPVGMAIRTTFHVPSTVRVVEMFCATEPSAAETSATLMGAPAEAMGALPQSAAR